VLPGASHYTFLNSCSARGRRFVDICRDARGVDREGAHDMVGDRAAAFFDSALSAEKPETSSADDL